MLSKTLFIAYSLFVLLLLQSCSGSGFHLRKPLDLPLKYQTIKIENLPYENDFVKTFESTLEESGGKLANNASTIIKINNFRESKRVIAYTKERKAREYLLSLKFDYSVGSLEKQRINLDRVFIYDSNFALGKAEEESQIRQNLYAEAARLILLKLQYSKN